MQKHQPYIYKHLNWTTRLILYLPYRGERVLRIENNMDTRFIMKSDRDQELLAVRE